MARGRPPEVDFQPLDARSYGIGLPGGAAIRVTTDPDVFEFSSLLAALDVVGEPSEFPLANWPGVNVALIA